MSTAIEFNNVSKQYKLGLVSTKTLSHDLNRWWQTKILRKEDPYLKIGSVNDRSAKADSDYVWALKDIDFKVEQGDVVGIIGKNGAGKSTLLKLLSRVTNPTTGTISARGRIASLLEVGTGFHPELTGRENIYMNGSIMGMSKSEITRKLDEIVDFSGCERYIDTPVKRYSSGMTVRLGFAIAAHLDPEILVVDEVLAVGDAEFQKKAIGKMQDVSKGEGRTVLFVSHNMASIRALCKTGVLLEHGTIKDVGLIDKVVEGYLSMNDESLLNIELSKRIDRKGDKRAILSNLVMIVDGKLVNSVQLLTPATFKFEIESKEEIEDVEVMYSIYNQHGLLVLSSNSKFASEKQFSLKRGINIFSVSYNEFPLSCGVYKINVRIRDKYEKDIDWIENAFRFSIVESDIYGTGKFYKDSSSIMILPHKWII
jgi:lipopolysaccharide transport system ATP-binding protein